MIAAPVSGISRPVQAELLQRARQVARSDGDAHPYGIRAVRTTRLRSIRLQPGTTAPTCEQSASCADAPVYVIAMRGRFSCGACPGPPGSRAPRGTVITLVLEGPRLFDSVFALQGRYPKLARAGTVVHLH
jgi:hypothetical protein